MNDFVYKKKAVPEDSLFFYKLFRYYSTINFFVTLFPPNVTV